MRNSGQTSYLRKQFKSTVVILLLALSSLSMLHAGDIILDFDSYSVGNVSDVKFNGMLLEPTYNSNVVIKQARQGNGMHVIYGDTLKFTHTSGEGFGLKSLDYAGISTGINGVGKLYGVKMDGTTVYTSFWYSGKNAAYKLFPVNWYNLKSVEMKFPNGTALLDNIKFTLSTDQPTSSGGISPVESNWKKMNGIIVTEQSGSGFVLKQGNKAWPILEQMIPESLPPGAKLRILLSASSNPGGATLNVFPWQLASSGGGHINIGSNLAVYDREFTNNTNKTINNARLRFYFADSSGTNSSGQSITVKSFSYEIVAAGGSSSSGSNTGGTDTGGTDTGGSVPGTANTSPIANFNSTPNTGTAPLNVTVSAAGSYDPDGSLVSYDWNFGDGSTYNGYSTTHSYNSAGTYTLKLTVKDNLGAVTSKTTQITVTAVAPPPPAPTNPEPPVTGGGTNPGPKFSMQLPSGGALAGNKPRVFVSSDIRDFSNSGEYDDKQAMIALMTFLDVIDLEGIHGNPAPIGRIINAYAQDLSRLRTYSSAYPDANTLRSRVSASANKYDGATLLINAANRADSRPLYVLTWGGVDAVSEAVSRQPSIRNKIRIISIGLGNTVGPKPGFTSLYNQRNNLWWILNQPTHRGIYRYSGTPAGNWGRTVFPASYIKNHGALGNLYPKNDVRMGDFPSLMYLLRGNPSQPTTNHWGGRFQKVAAGHGSKFSGGASNFWTDVLDTSEMLWQGDSYDNPWKQKINRGGEKTVTQYMMQFLPELAARFDRAKYAKGTNPSVVNTLKYVSQ